MPSLETINRGLCVSEDFRRYSHEISRGTNPPPQLSRIRRGTGDARHPDASGLVCCRSVVRPPNLRKTNIENGLEKFCWFIAKYIHNIAKVQSGKTANIPKPSECSAVQKQASTKVFCPPVSNKGSSLGHTCSD